MITYLKNVEYAIKNIFLAINYDADELKKLLNEYENLVRKPEALRQFGHEMDYCNNNSAMRAMSYFYQAEMAEKERDSKLPKLNTLIQETTDSINIHKESVSILCGSMLQFAKQGISISYPVETKGLPETCPPGREIGSECLSNIIWQARNHAIHYEESPNHNQSVKDCFSNLENEFGEKLSLSKNPGMNLSKEIIDNILKWSTYEAFENDMQSLA